MINKPRFTALAAALLLVAAVVLAGCTSSAATRHHQEAAPGPATGNRPNIVFVLTDDLSDDLVQYMPHVEAMMAAGTSFSHYYVVDSLCCPSRSAIFTGLYPHDDGVFTNGGSDGGYGAFQAHRNASKTFAVALQRAGYRTAMMGKYLNGYLPQDGPQPGWDEWDVAGNGYPEYDYQLNQDGVIASYGHAPGDYLTDVISQRAGQFIQRSAADHQPFALEVATFAPHRPFTPAAQDLGKFPTLDAPRGPEWDRLPTDAPSWLKAFPPLTKKHIAGIDHDYRRRVESIQSVDRMIGHLEAVLRAEHELDDTYFVFSSDNGYHMGQYRMLPGKQTAFDTDINVPFVVDGPGVPQAHVVSAMTSSIDVAPTFEQIAGATATDDPDGVSMLPLWHGTVPADWQRAVLIEHHGPDDKAVAGPDYQPILSGDPPSYEAVRTPEALYVRYDNGQREYYDLATDPDELHNIVGTESPAVLAGMQRLLTALEDCHGHVQCQAAAR